MIYHINQKDLPERGLLPLMAGYVHNLWCIHIADFARLIQRLIKKLDCIGLCGGLQTTQKRTSAQIPIGFCVNLSVSLSVSVSVSV